MLKNLHSRDENPDSLRKVFKTELTLKCRSALAFEFTQLTHTNFFL